MRTLLALLTAASLSACSLIVDTDPYVGDGDGGSGRFDVNAGPDQVVPPSANVMLEGTASGRSLTYRWEQTSGPTVTLSANEASASFTAPATRATLVFTLFVSDGAPPEESDTVTVEVNTPPVAKAGPDRVVMNGGTVYLDGGPSYDVDDEALTFTWQQTSGPGVTLTGADSPVATFPRPMTPGAYGFEVSVCDANGCTTDSVTLTFYRYTQLAAGGSHGLALRSDGTLWTWGDATATGLGTTYGDQIARIPVQVPGLSNVTAIWSGPRASYARSGSTTYAWGENCFGEAGYARVAPSGCDTITTPKPLEAAFEGFTSVARGDKGAMFLRPNGSLQLVGEHDDGELGVCPAGTFTSAAPGTLAGPFRAISEGWAITNAHGFGIRTTGTLYAWGYGGQGQLGIGGMPTGCTSQTSVGLLSWNAVSAGRANSAGITTGGQLYSWGFLEGGAGTNPGWVPQVRGNATDWIAVSAGDLWTLALKQTGALHAWGDNSNGELGLGDLMDRPSTDNSEPPRVGTDSNWSAVATSSTSSLALKTDGSIYTWGFGGGAIGHGPEPQQRVLEPRSLLHAAPTCGDGIVSPGGTFPEACDDGAFNGNPGRCSGACLCPNTTVIYVDAAATGTGDGASWANAFTSVQTAIASAGLCSTIWVAEGTYVRSGGPEVPVVQMGTGTQLFGGFNGHETHFSQRNPAQNPTVLDGENTAYHVVVGGNGGMLSGFVVRNGNANGAAPHDSGGGLFLTDSGLAPFEVRDVTFTQNAAANEGGGAYVRPAAGARYVRIASSRFVSNTATLGGGLSSALANIIVRDSVFASNAATGAPGRGGALYFPRIVPTAQPRVHNALFLGNSASNDGAAIWNDIPLTGTLVALQYITVLGSTGAAEAIYTLGKIANSVIWNPDVANPVSGVAGVLASCMLGSITGGGVGTDIVALTTDSPFEMVGTGADARPYLPAGSACLDKADIASTVFFMPQWSPYTTQASQSPDTGRPDLGFHWTIE